MIVVLLVLMLLLPASAEAAGSGGAIAPPFTVSPANVSPGQTVTFAFQAEPGTLALFGTAVAGFGLVRRMNFA